MNMGNAAFDLAEMRAEQEREASIAVASAALARRGSQGCISCGDPIEDRRREALPSAERCILCQGRYEAEQRGHRK